MRPREARNWISVGRDVILIALGCFIVIYTLVWGEPPKPVTILAGIGLIAGGSRKQILDAIKNGDANGA